MHGLIQIYTGTGKGKTTAALGLALRARSHGLKVGYISFHKNPERWGYQEQDVLEKIGVDVKRFAKQHPLCDDSVTHDDLRAACLEGLAHVRTVFADNLYDVLILDEINISVRDGYVTEDEVVALVDAKPESVELVLTGRGATEAMIERADLVSDICAVKHPYDKGIEARKGIDF